MDEPKNDLEIEAIRQKDESDLENYPRELLPWQIAMRRIVLAIFAVVVVASIVMTFYQ